MGRIFDTEGHDHHGSDNDIPLWGVADLSSRYASIMDSTDSSWADQRRHNAAAQAARLQAREAAESAQAAQYLRLFIDAAQKTGIAPEPLYVHAGDGKGRAKTPYRGWYLKADQSVAVDTEGNFYVLTAPLSLRERLTGVRPPASPPPLILGKGGRDGEQIDLVEALDMRVPSWRS